MFSRREQPLLDSETDIMKQSRFELTQMENTLQKSNKLNVNQNKRATNQQIPSS